MTTEIERRLLPFSFPVEETSVYTDRNGTSGSPCLSKDYKAIVRKDNGKLIAIQRKTYKLVPNAEVIKPLLAELHKLDTSWYIDSSHSFVDDQRMRLQVTFPEIVLHDGRSEIAMSLYLHNSYDGTEGVRMYFGAIRAICKNGMVFGQVLNKFFAKHTMGLDIRHLHRELSTTAERLPVIQNRIQTLQEARVTKDLRMDVDRRLGKRLSRYVEQQESEMRKASNQWTLYNMLTYYISHTVKQRMRAEYQMRVSKLFGL